MTTNKKENLVKTNNDQKEKIRISRQDMIPVLYNSLSVAGTGLRVLSVSNPAFSGTILQMRKQSWKSCRSVEVRFQAIGQTTHTNRCAHDRRRSAMMTAVMLSILVQSSRKFHTRAVSINWTVMHSGSSRALWMSWLSSSVYTDVCSLHSCSRVQQGLYLP